MDCPERILGRHVARSLAARSSSPVLTIGKDQFSRSDLAGVSCFNFLAAQRLTNMFRDRRVANTRDVFENLSPESLALPSLGAISLAVLGAAFEARGLGGEHPLESWMLNHATNRPGTPGSKSIVTFGTLKHRRQREAVESRRRRRRPRPSVAAGSE